MNRKMLDFSDKVVIITGAGGRIGAETVELFLRQGARVVMLSTCRFQDVVDVVRCFNLLGKPGSSLDQFMTEAEGIRRARFAPPGALSCKEDPVKPAARSRKVPAPSRLAGSVTSALARATLRFIPPDI